MQPSNLPVAHNLASFQNRKNNDIHVIIDNLMNLLLYVLMNNTQADICLPLKLQVCKTYRVLCYIYVKMLYILQCL